jgi:hypothetical protein
MRHHTAPSYHAKTLPSYCILGQIGKDGNVAVIILVIGKTGYLRALLVICLGWGRSADAGFAPVADQSIVVLWGDSRTASARARENLLNHIFSSQLFI